MIAFSNGRYHPVEEPAVTLGNGGFLHGLGVFTTLRLYRGQAPDLHAHLQRLTEHGRQLELPPPPARGLVHEVISELVTVNNLQEKDMRLRLTVALAEQGAFFSAVPGPLPPGLASWQEQGMAAICLGPSFQRAHLPALKTLNYLPSMMALREAQAHQCPEAIILDRENQVLEGAVSNLFLFREAELFTPPDDGRILAGLTRKRVLDLARQAGLVTREAPISLAALRAADEVFLTNSIREVVPVTVLDGKPMGAGKPGELTCRLQAAYRTNLLKTK
jgi:branched-chain amino acid aminotransferase